MFVFQFVIFQVIFTYLTLVITRTNLICKMDRVIAKICFVITNTVYNYMLSGLLKTLKIICSLCVILTPYNNLYLEILRTTDHFKNLSDMKKVYYFHMIINYTGASLAF